LAVISVLNRPRQEDHEFKASRLHGKKLSPKANKQTKRKDEMKPWSTQTMIFEG
jgi:hypothetical protein